jgi:rhodanese-related sulfurtransferase
MPFMRLMSSVPSLRKWLILALAAPALFLLLRSYATAENGLSPSEAAAWIKENKQLQLIDVRSEAEYATGRLAEAKLIPVQEIEDRLSEIDEHHPVLLYCRTGHRSGYALKILRDHDYSEAKHLAGGINAWRAAGLPIVR